MTIRTRESLYAMETDCPDQLDPITLSRSQLMKSLNDEAAGKTTVKVKKKRSAQDNKKVSLKTSKKSPNIDPHNSTTIPSTNMSHDQGHRNTQQPNNNIAIKYIKSDSGPYKTIIMLKTSNN